MDPNNALLKACDGHVIGAAKVVLIVLPLPPAAAYGECSPATVKE